MTTVESLFKTITSVTNIGVSLSTLGAHKVTDNSPTGVSTVGNTQALTDLGIVQAERVLSLVTMIKGLLLGGTDSVPDWDQIKPTSSGVGALIPHI
jgi:hypothetical protein